MNDNILSTLNSLKSFSDKMLSCLNKNLNCYIIGNQALVDPMNLEEKLEFFHALCDMGFKEIEIGFPSASETEYEGQHCTRSVLLL